MQLAVAALGKVFAGIGLSSAATATAATTTAGLGSVIGYTAPAAASSSLGALQGFATTLKLLSGIGSGVMAMKQANDQASEAKLQATQEEISHQSRKLGMSRELAKVLGQNEVAFAAAGIDLTGGIAEQSAKEAKARAADEISIDRQDTDFQKAIYRMRARGYRNQGIGAMGGALLGALGTGANYAIDLKERG